MPHASGTTVDVSQLGLRLTGRNGLPKMSRRKQHDPHKCCGTMTGIVATPVATLAHTTPETFGFRINSCFRINSLVSTIASRATHNSFQLMVRQQIALPD